METIEVDIDEIIRDDEKREEEILNMAMRLVIVAGQQIEKLTNGGSIERPFKRRCISNIGAQYLENVTNDDPIAFRVLYRMYPYVFRKLCWLLRDKAGVRDTRFVSVEEMVASFLLTVGQNSRYCQTRDTFGRYSWTTSTNFNQILKAINSIGHDMMAKPTSTSPVPTKIRDSTRFFPYFKDCIGVIDGTHIPASVLITGTLRFRNRHGDVSQNVMGVCNFDLKFIYVLSGWEGSAHDTKVLKDGMTPAKGFTVPQGKYYLVDGGYPNRRSFLAPVRGVRYHLQDFSGQGRHPEYANELFNLYYASFRNVVEMIFGVFKSRFTIFKSAPPLPFKRQAELVTACAALHNFLRKECRSDEFPIEDVDPDDAEVEDEDFGGMTQEQQRVDAAEWRNNLATSMWNDVAPQHDAQE